MHLKRLKFYNCLLGIFSNSIDKKEIKVLANSTKIEERYLSAKKCAHYNEDWSIEILESLLQDDNSKVKFAAIKSAMELKEDVFSSSNDRKF